MLSERLKNETAEAHKKAEGGLPFFKQDFTVDQYKSMLQRLHDLYQPLEKSLATHLDGKVDLNLSERLNKADLLKADLSELGLFETTSKSKFTISSVEAAIGTLYVIEGSTLGGQIISKKLKSSLQLSEPQMQFFRGYGDKTGPMWQKFKTFLDSESVGSYNSDKIVAGAEEAFTFISEAMKPVQ